LQDIPLPWLFALLVLLVALSAFFSSTETALMSINATVCGTARVKAARAPGPRRSCSRNPIA